MNTDLKGRHALVGGSSKGIGKATALALAEMGASVTLVARSGDIMAEMVHALDRGKGQDHDFLVVDFNDSVDLRKKVIGMVSEKVVHILVNNTGGPPGGPILDAPPEAFLEAFHNHLICNQLLAQLVVPGMVRAGYGRIINIISTSVKAPLDNLGVSNTTRAAVANWSKTLANELGHYGITVNNVLPGMTDTGRLQDLLRAKADKENVDFSEVVESMKSAIPMGRFARPEEVAAAVAFLATPAASYITGVNVPVDGGRTRSL